MSSEQYALSSLSSYQEAIQIRTPSQVDTPFSKPEKTEFIIKSLTPILTIERNLSQLSAKDFMKQILLNGYQLASYVFNNNPLKTRMFYEHVWYCRNRIRKKQHENNLFQISNCSFTRS
jgi:hypothetical protein